MFIIYFLIRIDQCLFLIFKKVCRFVQEWTGVISFNLARACSCLLLLGSVTLLFVVLFGQMTSQYRISLLFVAAVTFLAGYNTWGYANRVERSQSIYTKNMLEHDRLHVIARLYITAMACVQSHSNMKGTLPEDGETRDSLFCGDVLTVMIWTAVAFLYFVAINPDPLGPSRIDRMIRRLFPRSA